MVYGCLCFRSIFHPSCDLNSMGFTNKHNNLQRSIIPKSSPPSSGKTHGMFPWFLRWSSAGHWIQGLGPIISWLLMLDFCPIPKWVKMGEFSPWCLANRIISLKKCHHVLTILIAVYFYRFIVVGYGWLNPSPTFKNFRAFHRHRRSKRCSPESRSSGELGQDENSAGLAVRVPCKYAYRSDKIRSNWIWWD